MLRNALLLAILAVSTPAIAADSDTASKLHATTTSGDSLLSILAFAIIFITLSRLLVRTSDG